MVFVAVRTVAVIKHTLFNLLSDAEERKDLASGQERGGRGSGSDCGDYQREYPASQRYQAGLRDDIRKDWRSIAVTKFTSNILAPTSRSSHRSRQDLRESRIDIQGALSWPECS
jgi:hypothetical protein